jgi:hypothetical protein
MAAAKMTERLIVDGTPEAVQQLKLLLAGFQLGLLKGMFNYTTTTVEADEATRKGSKKVQDGEDIAKVKYVAVAGRDIMESLGDATVRGILFGHVLKAGEKGITAAELIKITRFTKKSVQSGLDKLYRADGFIKSVPLAGAQTNG